MPDIFQHLRPALLISVVLLGGCSERAAVIDAIRASGELRIAILASPTTFYAGPHGFVGFEHDLTIAFAHRLGVEPRFIFARDYQHLRRLVANNRAHIAAALLPVSRAVMPGLHYGPTYAVGRQLVVHRRSQPRPQAPSDLIGWRGATIHGRGAAGLLEHELPVAAGYEWQVHNDLTIGQLLQQLDDGTVDYAVLPSFEFEAARRNYPELRVAFELGVPQPVAWLYRAANDRSLWQAQLEFLRHARSNGEFARIQERYFGYIDDFDYVGSRAFLRHYEQRMPLYKIAFIAAGAETGIDWPLLAAVSYQESHWRADARSPTGVRGLMMLTQATAALLEVDRLDPDQSILGGARYLQRMKARLPERITEPERTWLALAAYNVGLAHLEDARVFTAQAGKNPDHWADVKLFLPKLSNRVWANKARHGYARGYQAVHFVRNVRRSYAVLRRLESAVPANRLLKPTPESRLVSPVL